LVLITSTISQPMLFIVNVDVINADCVNCG